MRLPWTLILDTVLNVVGFIPLGAVLYGYLRQSHGMLERFKGLATVIFCMLSAVIEMTQAWIPMRFSSLLDLILNVLGGALGMLYWKILPLKIIPGGR